MRWTCFSCVCKNVLPAYSSAKIIKVKRVFPELCSQMYCQIFYETVYIRTKPNAPSFLSKLSLQNVYCLQDYVWKQQQQCQYVYYFARGSGCEVLWLVRLSVCLCVCLSVRQNISGTTRAIFSKFFVRVACVRGSVILWHVDDRPHRLSAGREGVDGSAQRGRSVIYDCLIMVLRSSDSRHRVLFP